MREKKARVTWGKGGVSAKRSPLAGTFINRGGPIVANPTIHSIYWGSAWEDSAHKAQSKRLDQFLQDLLRSSIMNLLSQYGVGAGTFFGSFTDTLITGSLTDSDIQANLETYFSNGRLIEPNGNQVIVIFFDESTEVNDPGQGLVLCEPAGDTAFGYHNFFLTTKQNPCYYAIIPSLTDACIIDSCGGNAGCTLSLNDSQEQRRTEVATHEFGEMCSDPQLNAWTDDSGNEIGDVCSVKEDIVVGPNTWRVQTLWDNGANICDVGSSSTPPPPPGGTSQADITTINLVAYAFTRFLEKHQVHIDIKTKDKAQ
jgi:hypothetical protein